MTTHLDVGNPVNLVAVVLIQGPHPPGNNWVSFHTALAIHSACPLRPAQFLQYSMYGFTCPPSTCSAREGMVRMVVATPAMQAPWPIHAESLDLLVISTKHTVSPITSFHLTIPHLIHARLRVGVHIALRSTVHQSYPSSRNAC